MPNSNRFAGAPLSSEINVTPMIDVLLVLLIIFMAALPTRRRTMDVQLADREADAGPRGASSIVLEIDDRGALRINRRLVPGDSLGVVLRDVYAGRPDKVLFVKGSPHVTYDAVLSAMDVARGAGVAVIGLP